MDWRTVFRREAHRHGRYIFDMKDREPARERGQVLLQGKTKKKKNLTCR